MELSAKPAALNLATQDFVIHCVKRLLKIKDYNASTITFVPLFSYVVRQVNQAGVS